MTEQENESQRFRLLIAYDGRPFSGWQSQASGGAVQDELLSALRSICPDVATVQGSGRTDAGVCADGQVAHFDAPPGWRMGADEWRKALNANLPPEIRIMNAEAVSSEFHARFSAVAKRYRYQLFTGEVLPPIQVGLVWHRRGLSDLATLSEALDLYEGTHYFRSFSANRNDGKDAVRDTKRTIHEVKLRSKGDGFHEIHIFGNGFLYKMVRFLVGTAVYCAEGRVKMSEIRRLLESEGEEKAPFCAPPDGLSLQSVVYSDEC